MNEKPSPFHVVHLPAERADLPAINDLTWQHHSMFALLEVDVTTARQLIRDHKAQTGEALSFTGFLACCLARAVDENKGVQAYMKGRKQMVVFDDVDVGVLVERRVRDEHTLLGHVIRRANQKTLRQIHDEIRAAQSEPMPPQGGAPFWFRTALLLPWPLSSWFKALFRMAVQRDPTIFTSMTGTVGITSVGMFGKGGTGWGVSPVIHGLGLLVGSIAWKPAVVEGGIEPREMMALTIVFDHDVIDGGPAARFARRLVELIQSGYGLDDGGLQATTQTEAVVAPA